MLPIRGRWTIWEHNLKLFMEKPFYKKILGSGLGSESASVIGRSDEIWSSHNDWISLLMTVGIIGLILYWSILLALIRDILSEPLEKQVKGIFLAAILMLFSISFISNYIGRFEIIQSFWILGDIYHGLS